MNHRLVDFKREIRSANGKLLAFDLRGGLGSALMPLFERIGQGQRVYEGELQEMLAERSAAITGQGRLQASSRASAVVSMHGVATYATDVPGYCFSTLRFSQTINEAANDPAIANIILDIDTPGGAVTGTQEAADAVWAARRRKPVVGIINPLCASAGYWIGSQCTKLIAVPSADIGSIGVFMCHYDCSAMLADAGVKPTFVFAGEYKTEGNSMEPLSAKGRVFYQSEVDKTYQDFLTAVARGRGTSTAKVRSDFGGGRCFAAPDALRVGMVDAIAPLSIAISQAIATTSLNATRAATNRPARYIVSPPTAVPSVAQHRSRLNREEIALASLDERLKR